MTAEPHLEVRVRVARDAFALDVDLSLAPGLTLLAGPSGSGKSTLLGAISGALRPDAGRVALGGRVWVDRAEGARGVFLPPEARRVAVVFQSLALFPHMTAAENVAYGAPGGAAARSTTARDWLARLRVAHLADRRPRSLSGGEAQRVALARALAQEADVLLLDEPFSALDAATREAVLAEIGPHLASTRRVSVCITHREDELGALPRAVVRLSGGRGMVVAP